MPGEGPKQRYEALSCYPAAELIEVANAADSAAAAALLQLTMDDLVAKVGKQRALADL